MGLSEPIRSIRVIPELRSVHVERSIESSPAEYFFFTENYDLHHVTLPVYMHKVSFAGLLARLIESDAVTLELPEPLWVRFLPRTSILAIVWKISGIARRKERQAVFYAIENNSLGRLVGGEFEVPRLLLWSIGLALGGFIRLFIDRVAFGSDGARQSYMALPGMKKVASALFEELPNPSWVSAARVSDDTTEGQAFTTHQATFVGSLERRKGIQLILESWPEVELALPTAHITIIGPGPLTDTVETWVSGSPSTRRFLGQLPHLDIAKRLRESTVLIAPSIPEGRWKEQIGLPIKEALSVGLTIVTTDETGLAEWLEKSGHRVIPVAQTHEQLAPNIIGALVSPLNRDDVLKSLPTDDGRRAADSWLHTSEIEQSL